MVWFFNAVYRVTHYKGSTARLTKIIKLFNFYLKKQHLELFTKKTCEEGGIKLFAVKHNRTESCTKIIS